MGTDLVFAWSHVKDTRIALTSRQFLNVFFNSYWHVSAGQVYSFKVDCCVFPSRRQGRLSETLLLVLQSPTGSVVNRVF